MFDLHKSHKSGNPHDAKAFQKTNGHPEMALETQIGAPPSLDPGLPRASDPFRGSTPVPIAPNPMAIPSAPVVPGPVGGALRAPSLAPAPPAWSAMPGPLASPAPPPSVPAPPAPAPAIQHDAPPAWATDAEDPGHPASPLAPVPASSPSPLIAVNPASRDAGPLIGGGTPLAQLTEGIKLLERLIHLVRDRKATDVHLVEGERPRVRLHGDLLPLEARDHPLVTRNDIVDILNHALGVEQKAAFEREQDIDFSIEFRDAMGRVNVGYANGRRLQLVLRYLPSNLIPLDDLGIDVPMLKSLIATESGLIIVTGETSSGKTTTIIAMLDYINHNRAGSISTIENPIEYVLRSDRCLIARREVGRDTPSFLSALRAAVRKNPDVLLIGEIRDHESGTIAMSAAETGIQTFCTLHSVGSIQAITRLGNIMIGGGHDEGEFYNRLANILRGIVAQQLVKTVDGKTVIPLYEILNITYSEKRYLRERDFARLENSLESERNISIGECVYRLWNKTPCPIDESVVRMVFGDQFKLAMNRLQDKGGWKPLVTGMG